MLLATGGVDTTFLAIEAQDPSNFDMLKNTTFIGIISLMGWGLGYFGQPHILARFMAADSVKSIAKARRISMTWMILCLGGTVAVGFFGIAYFSAHPDVAGAVVREPRACVHRTGQDPVQPMGRRCPAVGHSGCGHEHPELPVAGVLERPDRRLLQDLPA